MIGKILVLSFVAVCIVAQSNNYEWGRREYNDSLTVRQFVKKSSKLLQIVTEDVDYPNKTTNIPPNRMITYIRVLDQKNNGNGGSASLNYGGVGFNTVGIHLKSKRNHGIDNIVEIYTR